MSQIYPIDPSGAQGKASALLGAVKGKLGVVPNLMRVLANSPAALEGYLSLSGALARGTLGAKLQEQIALTVAEANSCDYCLAAHSLLGQGAGLAPEDIELARGATAHDAGVAAALRFAREVVDARGQVSEESANRVKAAGFNDGQVIEIVVNIAVNILTNYVNHVAATEIDFPAAKPRLARAA